MRAGSAKLVDESRRLPIEMSRDSSDARFTLDGVIAALTLSSLETRFAPFTDAFVVLTETVKLMEAFSLTAGGANLEIGNPADLTRFHLHDTPEAEFMTDDQAGSSRRLSVGERSSPAAAYSAACRS